jgi:Ca2+-binding EF-hand superfamily protein
LASESERLKQELATRYDFSPEHIFKEVDDWNYKYIDPQNLKRFLIKTGVFPNDALLISIIRRFDLDADAKLNFKEFAEGIIPLEGHSKRTMKGKTNANLSATMNSSSKKN